MPHLNSSSPVALLDSEIPHPESAPFVIQDSIAWTTHSFTGDFDSAVESAESMVLAYPGLSFRVLNRLQHRVEAYVTLTGVYTLRS